MQAIDERAYAQLVHKLEAWVDELAKTGEADKPLLRAGGAREVSPRDILKEVKEHTDYGKRFVEGWVDLAMDHILNAPLKPMSVTDE